MKLNEIKDDFPHRLNLFEVYNSKADVKWYFNENGRERGDFKIDDMLYTIIYDEWNFLIGSRKIHVIEIGFTWQNERGEHFSTLTGLNKNASLIIGCVKNAVLPKIEKDDPEVILIAARDEFGEIEKRTRLYGNILTTVQKQTKYTVYKDWFRIGGAMYSYISIDLKLSDEEYKEFIQALTKEASDKSGQGS